MEPSAGSNGSLFGNVPFDRMLDEDNDDESLGSRESDFETESLESSSSNSDPLLFSSEHHLHRRHHQTSASEESSTDGNTDEVPNWFYHGSFKYNGRVAALALPGLVLALLFAGEMLLGMVTVGMLVMYVVYSTGSRQRALVTYFLLFVAIQLTVVYSVLPLIWKSLLNVFIVLSLNIYTFMIGGWILLLFENIRFREIELLMLIETGLFTLYPTAFIAQVTWLVSAMSTVGLAPYVLMLIGFAVFQVFLTPVQSSFIKPHAQGSLAVWDSEGYVLSPVAMAIIAGMYAVANPSLVLLIRATGGWKTFVSSTTIIQLLFVTSCSIFLASFFHLRLFMEGTGLPHKVLLSVRWSAALVTLSLTGPLLSCYDIQSTLLPFMPFLIIFYMAVVLATLKKHKVATYISLTLLAVVFFFIFLQLPWQLDYYLAAGSVSITFVESLLVLNAVLCVISMYVAIYRSVDDLGICLLVQSVGFILSSKLLVLSGHMSLILLMLSAIFYSYLILRLYHSGRLHRRASLVLSALHVGSLLSSVDHLFGSVACTGGVIMNIYNYLAALALSIVLLRLLVFEECDVFENKELLRHGCALCLVSLANVPILITDLLIALTGGLPTFSLYLGFVGVLSSVIYLKLVCLNGCAPIQNKLSLFVMVAVPSLAMLALRPELSLNRVELQKWAAVVGVGCAVAVAPMASAWRGSVHIIGAALGFPAGLCALHVLFPRSPALPVQVTFGILAMLCLMMLLVAWYQPRNTDHWLKNLAVLIGITCLLLFTLSFVMPVTDDEEPSWPTVTFVALFLSLTLVSVVIWMRHNDMETEYLEVHAVKVDTTPFVGNVCTVASYVVFATNWPPAFNNIWYIWVCASSPLLLLLSRDPYVLCNLRQSNRFSPLLLAITVALHIATFCDCAVFSAIRMYEVVFGVLELICVVAGLPVVIALQTVTYYNKSFGLDIFVVFLTPPYVLLILTGTTYASWILACWGLSAGYWLMRYKLLFEGYT